MGLYNMLFGRNPMAPVLLAMCGLSLEDVGRFRDAWIEEDGENVKLAVYTRMGGPNREDYEECIDALQEDPLYLSDVDDLFDHTYATFYFKVPEEHRALARKLAIPPQDMSEAWQRKIEEVGQMSAEEVRGRFPGIVKMFEEITSDNPPPSGTTYMVSGEGVEKIEPAEKEE